MQAKLMEMAALAALIGGIGKQRVAFDGMVQQACVEVIGQSIAHRNATPANQLLDTIGSHLKPVVVAHLEKFGNLAYSKTDKVMKFYEVKGADGKVLLAWTEPYAKLVAETLWIKAKKEIEPKSVFDVADEIGKLVDRLAKAGVKGAELKNKPLLQLVTAAYNKYQAETYLAGVKTEPQDEEEKSVDLQAAAAALQEQLGSRKAA